MKLGMIIPFINEEYLHGILDDIFKNDGRPDSILLIDNRADRIGNVRTRSSAIEFYVPEKPLSVNEAWNYGIDFMLNTRKCDLISVFNDDLILEKWFFDKLRTVAELDKYKQFGVFCPETMHFKQFVAEPEFYCMEMRRRQGWAWTIRAEVARQIPPIPTESLKTFCGDDWYYVWCNRLERPWAKVVGMRCFHYVGASMKAQQGQAARAMLKNEKRAFDSLI